MPKVLVVDDEPNICEMIAYALRAQAFEVDTAGGGRPGIELIGRGGYEVVITDVMMPDVDGFAVLDAARALATAPAVVVITGFGSIGSAVDAMKRGASEYITKPLDISRLIETVRSLLPSEAPAEAAGEADFAGLIGDSEPMEGLRRIVAQVAPSSSTVLVCGESGTGKELVAQAVHRNSRRSGGPFIAVDCGALTETLLESELFGHVQGAFTGAVVDKAGLFEAANVGTILLDEVGEMSPRVQQKLLRCIQERVVRRVGSTETHAVDVRIVAATNRDLAEMVAAGQFRQDLFYRLNVVQIRVPPLAERREDIPLLAEHFARKIARQLRRRKPGISPAVMAMLGKAEWPGNVRQLENVIECAVTFAEGDEIRPEHLSPDFIQSFALAKDLPAVSTKAASKAAKPADITPLGAAIRYLETQMLTKAMDASNGKKEQAAQMLGIDRATLYRKLKMYGLKER